MRASHDGGNTPSIFAPVLSDKLYNGGEWRTLALAKGTTLGQVKALQAEIGFPDDAMIEVDCDHYQGDSFPDQAIEISWPVVHPGRPQTLSERHQAHYQSCNCLADSAVCCDPACPCKQTDPGRGQSDG